MTRILSLLALSATLFVGLLASSAQAQTITRTFVSGMGSDSNPCTYALPCRHLQNAYAVTPANGEIDVLDPAGYGNLNISQPISLLGHGYTSMSAPSSGLSAISIYITSGAVNISGVEMDGGGNSGTGITFGGVGTLNVEDSVIRNFASYGLYYSANAASQIFVTNTLFSNIDSAIVIFPGQSGQTADVSGVIDHVHIDNSSSGISTQISEGASTINLTISDSVIANGSFGINCSGNGAVANQIQCLIRNTTVANNGNTGISMSKATGWVTRSSIFGNYTGLNVYSDSTLISYGDNDLANNTIPGSFSSTISHQ